MKKYPCIPAIVALVFLVGGCTLPAVHDPTPRRDEEAKAATSAPPQEKPAPPAVRPETKGKRVSLIPQDNAGQTAKGIPANTPPAPASPSQETQSAPAEAQPQNQVFTEYNTGLAFSYQQPWHLVSTQGEGPILGRNGRSQLIARFAILTTDKDKSEHRGYFHVPGDSLTETIGKTVQSTLGAEDKQTTPGKTPLDVLLTKKHFPSLIIEQRYRGNNGGVVVQECRHKQRPGPIQVYHVFIGDRVASFSLSEVKNRRFKLEMQQIVFSTRKL